MALSLGKQGRGGGGGGGGLTDRMELRGFSHHVLPNAGVPTVCKAENRLLVVQNEEHLHEMPLLAQVVDEVIHMRKHSQAFRLRVCILLLIEN